MNPLTRSGLDPLPPLQEAALQLEFLHPENPEKFVHLSVGEARRPPPLDPRDVVLISPSADLFGEFGLVQASAVTLNCDDHPDLEGRILDGLSRLLVGPSLTGKPRGRGSSHSGSIFKREPLRSRS